MKRLFILIILSVSMTLSANSQWRESDFFDNVNKASYVCYLQTKASYPLSKGDTHNLIDILSCYEWEEKKGHDETSIEEVIGGGWQYYHYYVHNYYIAITHPDKRNVRLGINSGGLGKDEFVIEYSNGKMYGVLRIKGILSNDDVKKIKDLFLYNVSDFNSISLKQNERIQITPVFSFYFAFHQIELPPIYLDEQSTEEFIKLYNSAWNNEAVSGGGDPILTLYLYEHYNTISYGDKVLLAQHPFHTLEFKEKDKQTFTKFIKNALKECEGKAERTLHNQNKIVYQYKNGALNGTATTYTSNDKLVSELTYENGFPIHYTIYSEWDKKEKEFYFNTENVSAIWTEYGKNGEIKEQGKSYYKPFYHRQDDINNFYKEK